MGISVMKFSLLEQPVRQAAAKDKRPMIPRICRVERVKNPVFTSLSLFNDFPAWQEIHGLEDLASSIVQGAEEYRTQRHPNTAELPVPKNKGPTITYLFEDRLTK